MPALNTNANETRSWKAMHQVEWDEATQVTITLLTITSLKSGWRSRFFERNLFPSSRLWKRVETNST